MIVTNHDKIYYRPFRKDFYTVVPEIANMTELGKSEFFLFLSLLKSFSFFFRSSCLSRRIRWY